MKQILFLSIYFFATASHADPKVYFGNNLGGQTPIHSASPEMDFEFEYRFFWDPKSCGLEIIATDQAEAVDFAALSEKIDLFYTFYAGTGEEGELIAPKVETSRIVYNLNEERNHLQEYAFRSKNRTDSIDTLMQTFSSKGLTLVLTKNCD